MAQQLYVEGLCSDDGRLSCPLVSSALLFVSRYCQSYHFKYFIVIPNDLISKEKYVSQPSDILAGLNVEYIKESGLPCLVKNCILPVSVDEETSMFRSGLCGTVRHLIQSAHQNNPGENFIDLLGFRNGSLRMCAEVSGWTKLCEIELPDAIFNLVSKIRKMEDKEESEVVIPVDLLKLEMHFDKPPKIHNDHKIKKHIIVQNRDEILQSDGGRELLESLKRDRSDCLFERDVTLPHGIRRYRIYKNVKNNLYLKSDKKYAKDRVPKYKPKDKERPITLPITKTDEEKSERRKEKKKRKLERREAKRIAEIEQETLKMNLNQNNSNNGAVIDSLDSDKHSVINSETDSPKGDKNHCVRNEPYSIVEIMAALKTIAILDVEFIHVYSEGLEMTVADLILFVYCYFLMERLNFKMDALKDHLPNITTWLAHMLSLPRIQKSCQQCGLSWNRNTAGIDNIMFKIPSCTVTLEEDMELHRRNKSTVRAIKPEVTELLQSIDKSNIDVKLGNHPCDDDISINWDVLPLSAHPQEGAVPRRRIERKCQQLENLVTAVVKLAKSDDIIVDFCSGGGHLGIVIAYLLPNCKIYLIENKEESIERARIRIESLQLTNVVIYQCNLDYFHGNFNIGVCLHACGVATDMVLQQCLDNTASFVICPCCYGSIVKTHKISYPRSQLFTSSGIRYKDFLTLGHAADQTEFNIALADQGVYCANLVDTDRAELARENNYTVDLCTLKPKSCTPKNNLLIGVPC